MNNVMPATADPAQRMLDHQVIVIGAGFGGLGAGTALQRKGIHDFVILDKWDRVGGTWHANTYPGVAVDIPSFIYSFSYAQRGDWSRVFAPGAELQNYAEELTDRYGLREKLRLNTTVLATSYDEIDCVWSVRLDDGRDLLCRHLVLATGGLERPKMPDIEGIDDFEGHLVHTALWDEDIALSGQRVAVIGTGATALQLIPAIAGEVGHLSVFQRTPIWVFPKYDARIGRLGRQVLSSPPIRSALRMAGNLATEVQMSGMLAGPAWVSEINRRAMESGVRRWMRGQVRDPDLREKLIPQYGLGCKRPSMSNEYLKTFDRDNVSLITDSIERITPGGVRTADGVEHQADVLVCATGFRLWEKGGMAPFPVFGRAGVDLGDFWDQNRFQAYQGVSVPGFPNLFTVIGPYGFVLGSYIWTIEATAEHLSRAIAETARRGAVECEIRRSAHDWYFEQCLRRQQKNFLFGPVCEGSNTYYLDKHGDSPFRPSTHGEMYWQNRHYRIDAYHYREVRTTAGDDEYCEEAV